jgi:hypothetical protein
VVRAAETLCRAWDAAVRCCGQVRAILAMQDGIGFGDRVAKEVDALLPAS